MCAYKIEGKTSIFITDTDENKRYYYDFLRNFNPLKDKKYHVAIDFEFDTQNKSMALMQLKFKFVVFIVTKETDMTLFIDNVILNENVYKVFHGSESLDLPFICSLLETKEKFNKFMMKTFDTKLFCDYFDKRCSLYDAMYDFGSISKESYDDMQCVLKRVGKIQKVDWKKLNDNMISYAYYDVLYLDNLLFSIFKNVEPKFVRSFYYIVDFTRFTLSERIFPQLLPKIKNTVDTVNTYFVDKKPLSQIYKEMLLNVVHDGDYEIYIEFLKKSNYVRGIIDILLKYVVYKTIFENNIVFKDKKTTINVKFDLISSIESKKIRNFLLLFEDAYKKYSEVLI